MKPGVESSRFPLEMDAQSDRLSAPLHHRPPPNPGRHEATLDESTRAYRTTALRHLNGTARPPLWKNRQTNHSSRQPPTPATQPVLVRAYSGGPAAVPSPSAKMSMRLSLSFTASSRARNREPELPSDEEFGIDGILRAIEPNIRDTLHSIGQICGRSRLSLANEYGSHIAPLGEIRAPPGGLVTVEEASSDSERQATDNVVIYDDENSVTDGCDHISFAHYGYFQHGRHPGTTASHGELPSMNAIAEADVASMQAQPHTPQSSGFNLGSDPGPELGLPTAGGESASRPRPYGRALLGKKAASGIDQTQGILTPAVVSEILLDAQAEGQPVWTPRSDPPPSELPRTSVLGDVHAIFGWLAHLAGHGADSGESKQTAAEMRLRTTLERQTDPASLGPNHTGP